MKVDPGQGYVSEIGEMIIAAFDVHYLKDGWASVASVMFHDYRDAEPAAEYTLRLPLDNTVFRVTDRQPA